MTRENIDDILAEEAGDSKPSRGSAVWRLRKRVVLGTLMFCAGCILYIMIQAKDVPVYDTIVFGCFGLAGSAIGFFIGGQTYHDINSQKIDALQQRRRDKIENNAEDER